MLRWIVQLIYFKVKLIKWRSLSNAVLRKINEERKKFRKNKNNLNLSIPEWFYKDWKDQYGKKILKKLLDIFQDEPGVDLRIKNKIDYWVEVLEGIKLGNNTVRIYAKGKIENIKGYKDGSWWVQDIAAQLPVLLMGNVKSKKVLDLCAAPGGKTMEMLSKGAFVKAIEISKERSEILLNNVKRVGLSKNLVVQVKDLVSFKTESNYDIVLLDAPCSGTGTFRKNPDVVWIKIK